MKWSLPLLFLVAAVLCDDDAELSHKSANPRPVGVVYLIDLITEPKTEDIVDDGGISNTIPNESFKSKGNLLLIRPIPIDQAGDGVYFRPENGQPLAEPEVIFQFFWIQFFGIL